MRSKNRLRRIRFPARRLARHNVPLKSTRQHLNHTQDAMSDDDEGSSIEELPTRPVASISAPRFVPDVPALFTSLPPIRDPLVTHTSEQQLQNAGECLACLQGVAEGGKTAFDFSSHGVPRLEREDHIEFLKDALQHARFMAYDPSRPWVVYWTLTGLSLLDQDVTLYRQRFLHPYAHPSTLNSMRLMITGSLRHSHRLKMLQEALAAGMDSSPIAPHPMPLY